MKIIDPTFEFIQATIRADAYRIIAEAMRNCYRSELNDTPKSDVEMVKMAVQSGHHSVLEHVVVTVNITCDRGVSHELVRHRLASYSQESTRFCNYSGRKFGRELTFVRPSWVVTDPECATDTSEKYQDWLAHMMVCEKAYLAMLDHGASAQEARAVLPNSLATKVAMTANLREWMHILKLRCDKPAHPDIRATMKPVLEGLMDLYPVIFGPTAKALQEKGAIE